MCSNDTDKFTDHSPIINRLFYNLVANSVSIVKLELLKHKTIYKLSKKNILIPINSPLVLI